LIEPPGCIPKISEHKLPAEKEKTKLQDTGRQVEARILEARQEPYLQWRIQGGGFGGFSNTCKLRFFQGNSFLNIIYFYRNIKGKCCCITKKNTRVSVLKICDLSCSDLVEDLCKLE
jgi:hypothetical protein